MSRLKIKKATQILILLLLLPPVLGELLSGSSPPLMFFTPLSDNNIMRYHIECGVSISGAYSELTAKKFSQERLKKRVEQAGQRRTIDYFIQRKFGQDEVLSKLKEYGFKNAILPLGKGHIELMQPIDPASAVAKFLKNHGEGVYLVGFDVQDVPLSAKILKEKGVRVTFRSKGPVAWLHPKDAHGVFVEMRKPEKYP